MRLPSLPLSRLLVCALLAVLVLHALGWLALAPVTQLERWSEDARIRAAATGQLPADRVAVIAIDEASLASVGRWPWPRATLATLLDTLHSHYGVARSGLDIVLAETEHNPLQQRWDALCQHLPAADCAALASEWRDALAPDAAFAERARRLDAVAGYYFTPDAARSGVLPQPDWRGPPTQLAWFVSAQGYGGTHAALAGGLPNAGFLNPEIDDDGIVRRLPLLIRLDDALYASLTARLASRDTISPAWLGDSGRLDGVQLDERRIATDAHGRIRIPFYGPPNTLPTYSAAAIIEKRLPSNTLKEKIVIIGATAPGLQDIRATPVSPLFPGVEAQAATLLGLLTDTLPQEPAWATLFGALATLLLGALMIWRLPAAGFAASQAWAGGALALLLLAVGWAWFAQRLLLPLVAPLLAIVLPYLWFVLAARWLEGRQRRQLMKLFGEYVPPELVARMQADPEQFDMKAENRELTVLFADLRNFTAVAEALPPDALAELVNAYLTAMTEEIHAHQGTIDKYIGDAVMAFWGAPLPDTDHARHAVTAALAMQRRMALLNRDFAARGWPQLAMGIGLHCGEMRVGNMGSRFRRAYTVMGDAVNVAARLEAQTRNYDVPVLISSELAAAIAPAIRSVRIDTVQVKGRQQPVTLCLPLDPELPWLSAEEQLGWDELQHALASGSHNAALALLEALESQAPERKLYGIYRKALLEKGLTAIGGTP